MEFDIMHYKEEALFLLSKLVSLPTVLEKYEPKGNSPFGIENKKCLEFILKYASKDGFDIFNADNYAGHIEFGKGKETLGILGHLDVVPVVGQTWSTDPFVLTIKEDRLYGRGVTDDKGPVVASYIALKLLKENGFVPKKKIRLILGCDEESGSRCLTHYFKKQPLPELGFSPDADFPLIYGEKAHCTYNFTGVLDESEIIEEFECGTRYNVVPAVASMRLKKDLKKEYLEFLKENNFSGEIVEDTYIAYGLSSHAMVPEKGKNASFILFKFLEEVHSSFLSKFFTTYLTDDPFGEKLGYQLFDEEMKALTSNVGIVQIKNKRVLIGIDCRVPLESHKDKMMECIYRACKDTPLQAEILNFGGYHYVDPKGFLVTSLMKAYRDATGDKVSEPFTIGGGTYAKFIDNAVAFGPLFPGREDVCHIADEYMDMSDFLKTIEIYARAIYELTK